jgi:hypothetical protein
MAKNELLANERRWRREPLLRKQNPGLGLRFIAILLVLGAFSLVARWLDIALVSRFAEALFS